MVKIRLRRMGTKGRPFYRIVVAQSTAARDGSFVEVIGTYNPLTQPKQIDIKKDRALHWLLVGAQPTDTTAYLLQKQGILDEFFTQRPEAKAKFKSLDKRTSAMSKKTAIDQQPAAPKAEATPVPAAEPEPIAEAAPEAAADAVVKPEAVAEQEAAPEPSAPEPAAEPTPEASVAAEEAPQPEAEAEAAPKAETATEEA